MLRITFRGFPWPSEESPQHGGQDSLGPEGSRLTCCCDSPHLHHESSTDLFLTSQILPRLLCLSPLAVYIAPSQTTGFESCVPPTRKPSLDFLPTPYPLLHELAALLGKLPGAGSYLLCLSKPVTTGGWFASVSLSTNLGIPLGQRPVLIPVKSLGVLESATHRHDRSAGWNFIFRTLNYDL